MESLELEKEKKYICSLNSTPLYEAKIKNFSGCGCWATVEVVNPIEGPHKKNYSVGQIFDIKVSYYEFKTTE